MPISALSTALAIAVDPVTDVLYVLDSGAIRVVGPSGDMAMVGQHMRRPWCRLGRAAHPPPPKCDPCTYRAYA